MKRPSFQFYPGDWLNDAALRMVSVAARGLWIEMICLMHQGSDYGYLKVNHKVILPANLARMSGATLSDAEGWLRELEDAGVFSRDEDGCIYSKRMIRDEQVRSARAAGGKLGGNPNLKPRGKDNLPPNLAPTPSSSSSSSSSKSKPKPSSSSGDDGATEKPFDRFWNAWPNKVAKQAAQKAWAKIKPDAALVDTILAAIEAQKQGDHWRRDDGQYIGHPATWLNGGRWLDEVRPYVEPKAKNGRGAWWATKESMEAFGLTLTPPLKPNAGEYPRDFAARINAALERLDSGQGPAPAAAPTPYVPPAPRGGESVLTPEQLEARRAEMLAAVGSKKKVA